jgi:hypothetical protein
LAGAEIRALLQLQGRTIYTPRLLQWLDAGRQGVFQ